MRLLLAYDGSAYGEVLLSDLKRAGLPANVEATTLSVADVWLPEAAPEWGDALLAPESVQAAVMRSRDASQSALQKARDDAESMAQRLREAFPQWRVSSEARADSPASAILECAEAFSAELIVLGAYGGDVWERLFLGSVAAQTLEQAHCSVRIARPSRRNLNGSRLLVGVDGSPQAQATVHAVSNRYWGAESAACVMTVLDSSLVTASLFSYDLGEENSEGDVLQARMQSLLEGYAERLQRSGLQSSTLLVEGDPRRELLREAEDWQADCLFVGAQGLRSKERFLMGSVARSLVERSPCSVEIVRDASVAI